MNTEKYYLELSEDGGASHKFYEVTVEEATVKMRFGRIGTDGTAQTQAAASFEEAKKLAEKKIAEKKKKGYAEAVMGQRKKRRVTRRFVESAPQNSISANAQTSSGRSNSTSRSTVSASRIPTLKLPMDWRFESGSMAFGISINENHCWIGNENGRVFKLTHTGEVLEQYQLPDGVKCIVADNDWIYVGCDDGNVYDLTGKLPRVAYAISDDVDIYWLDVNNGWLSVSDDEGHLVLFDYEGNQTWRKKGRGNSAWMIRSNFNGQVFYGDSAGVACYDANGAETWFTKTQPVLFGYQDKFALYAGTSQGNALCLSKNGQVLQTFRADAAVYSCAATEDGKFVFAGDNQGNVYCFGSDGSRLWKFPTNYGSVLSMQYLKDRLYIVTTFGHIASVNTSEEAIQQAQAHNVPQVVNLKAPEAIAAAISTEMETVTAAADGKIVLHCVKDGGDLRVRVQSPGYQSWFVQFPKTCGRKARFTWWTKLRSRRKAVSTACWGIFIN